MMKAIVLGLLFFASATGAALAQSPETVAPALFARLKSLRPVNARAEARQFLLSLRRPDDVQGVVVFYGTARAVAADERRFNSILSEFMMERPVLTFVNGGDCGGGGPRVELWTAPDGVSARSLARKCPAQPKDSKR